MKDRVLHALLAIAVGMIVAMVGLILLCNLLGGMM